MRPRTPTRRPPSALAAAVLRLMEEIIKGKDKRGRPWAYDTVAKKRVASGETKKDTSKKAKETGKAEATKVVRNAVLDGANTVARQEVVAALGKLTNAEIKDLMGKLGMGVRGNKVSGNKGQIADRLLKASGYDASNMLYPKKELKPAKGEKKPAEKKAAKPAEKEPEKKPDTPAPAEKPAAEPEKKAAETPVVNGLKLQPTGDGKFTTSFAATNSGPWELHMMGNLPRGVRVERSSRKGGRDKVTLAGTEDEIAAAMKNLIDRKMYSEKAEKKPAAKKGGEAPKPVPEAEARADKAPKERTPERRKALQGTLKDSYQHLKRFVEFRDGLVEIRRLWHEARKRDDTITLGEFHAELADLRKDLQVTLHALNEVHMAKEPDLAINQGEGKNAAMLYFLMAHKPGTALNP